MQTLKLLLFGPPRIELDGAAVDIQRRKALAMLAYLAMNAQPHSRDTLSTLFWPDHDQSRARAYLRRDLAVLNTGLAGEWLEADRDTVELKRGADFWLDVEQFRQTVAACRSHDHGPEEVCPDCVTLLSQAAALYPDDFLAGFTLRDSPEFDDWQFFQTESLRQELASVLERLVVGLVGQQKYEPAIPYARRWLALDPLQETAQRRLIELYDRAGQPAAALRQYEEYAKLLEEELGLPPEEETRTLYEAIKAKRILGAHLPAEKGRTGPAAVAQPPKQSPEAAAPPTPLDRDAAPGDRDQAVQICLLGRFEVSRTGSVLRAADWTETGAAMLLQKLALDRRLSAEQIIDLLSPEARSVSGSAVVDGALESLGQILDGFLGLGTAGATFSFSGGVVSLDDSVHVDVDRFRELAADLQPGETDQARPLARLDQALALYQGDLLPGIEAEWTVQPRELLYCLYREAVFALVNHHREAGNYGAGIVLLKAILARDPADETVHRELMRLYSLAGRRHEALRQYQCCVETLATELNAPPEPETEALYAQIVNGDVTVLPERMARPAWAPPGPIALEVERSAPLAGREDDLARLQARIRTALQGQGATIMLAGDVGVGKTRLAYEALRQAALARMTVMVGAAYEHEGHLPYQPFIEAFDRYLSEQKRPLEQNPITHYEPVGASDPQQEHTALFKAAAAFLTSLAKRNPVVLLVDDIHAADEASLNLFHYLARHTRSAPVILLASYRTDNGGTGVTPFSSLLNALYREHLSEVLTLAPLSEEAAADIISHTLEGQADQTLAAAIYDIAEGNPFFIQEITQAMRIADRLYQAEGQWRLRPGATLQAPAELRELLLERVQRLGPVVDSVLSAAAVFGREFHFPVLRQLTDLSDGELLDALDAALSGHLVEETEEGYRFHHSLIRHTLYEALSRARRTLLHTRAAGAVESVYANRPEGLTPHVEGLAFHYARSAQRERALPYLLEAGLKSATLYALEVASDYYEQALALMDELNISDPAERWRILEQLGWWALVLANTARAVAYYQQALALPPTKDWAPTLDDRVRVHRLMARTLITVGDGDRARHYLRAALEEVGGTELATTSFALLLYDLSLWHWHHNEHQEAFEVARRSLAIGERLNHAETIARAYEAMALASHSLGEWQEGLSFEQQRADLVGPDLDVTLAYDIHL